MQFASFASRSFTLFCVESHSTTATVFICRFNLCATIMTVHFIEAGCFFLTSQFLQENKFSTHPTVSPYLCRLSSNSIRQNLYLSLPLPINSQSLPALYPFQPLIQSSY